MLDNGLTPVGGRLWLVSEVVVHGRSVKYETTTDAGLFDHVLQLGFGATPAILFDPRPGLPEARFYPKGLSESEDYKPLRLIRAERIEISEILDVVDRLHRECLATPEAQGRVGKLWENKTKHYPTEQAEALIQLYLRAGLTGAFANCVVREEQHGVAGRLDLEIEEADPLDRTIVTRHAVLELKVLRSYTNTGNAVPSSTIDKWIEDGVEQAAAYRDDRGARAAALCCFNMRVAYVADECFGHVLDEANDLGVTLRVWHIFATSREYRRHLARHRR